MRDEHPIIYDWVKDGSTIIDLGCGDGDLLNTLRIHRFCLGLGIDKDAEFNGNIRYGLIDRKETYEIYEDNEFDYAICNVTLQMVGSPEILLDEMFRISKYQIISFPNFAKWQNRLELLFKGRMPKWMLCGYKWYDTEHLHQLSIKDFEDYIKDRTIIKKHFLPNRPFPNLTAHTAIYLCK